MQDHGSSSLRRRLQIVELARKSDAVKVEALSTLLGVSRVTIRGDLNYLEQQGYVVRMMGRARYNPALLHAVPAPQETPTRLCGPGPSRVAGAALRWIADGMALFLGGGALVHRLLPQLVVRQGLALTLHDLAMVATARQFLACGVHVTGGVLSDEEPGLIGPAAEQGLRSHPLDLCVLEVSGIDSRGRVLSRFAGAARLYAAAVSHCAKAISLSHGSDVGAASGHPVCSLDALDAFVVPHDAPPGVLELLARHRLQSGRKADGFLEFRKA
ncbi:DeoR/GlpR transcriptional regulator [Verminephrobacter aporrectodeae subsp. tuberculatae]|uniref:DeoR/GlpR family DNA-binding transcription regulator n=1 Tax=Verminephrobacter aporrectodeae TaxID=1110389 RepID=UPI002238A1EA|nr:DeoR/GlpR family DNA-binding transcription regulator [Verminephrobacter aporrectodeae]MCW5221530.1 DeoR/GlpR transcriptional regulator [Verminephrobacter aporrectodeae subsp. tuberculatae]MCW5290821.1 DeoR/GlpR transcriptional regulator [Verminephrobacter aporrectodeae subsp. tuberculatae]